MRRLFRVVVVQEPLSEVQDRCESVADADLLLSWRGEQANVSVDLMHLLMCARHPLCDAVHDLLDIAIALFIADIAIPRGRNEAWPRDISLKVPVVEIEAWESVSPLLDRLLFDLTRDRICVEFYPTPGLAYRQIHGESGASADCVSMLSGGLDSLAGAVMLQEAGRIPVYSMHYSGNPRARSAQQRALQTIDLQWSGGGMGCPCVVEPNARGHRALHFPCAEEREPSRRMRSLLFMAIALATAEAAGVDEVFMCENGVLTAALPLAPSRAGSLSTHSTHPMVIRQMNLIAERLGLRAQISNPFVYQTKGELLRDVLAPRLSIAEIQSTVSCWMTGRAQRQCGGCIPCLLRRLSMGWAGLPEEAYMIQLLEKPCDYVGTHAYGNLMDLLRQIRRFSTQTDAELLASQPGLLSLQETGVDFAEVIAMFRRHAEQSMSVVQRRYPAAADLID